ncbi:ECF-type sigma factor [Rubinisphaera margarita]|uniref:ECF-type sigma factor n=1 Tax=Rubinisphaera margarita TaxID=2909586 RepID=UPI001EE8533D|nr:ECF-type sigma factor [Rubinisphaera margarita]MCG6155945.1 ECF-type sigma factor [Rubinisphaera margarita]
MDSSSPGSISLMIDQLQQGETAAQAELWNRYFERLVPLARKRLGGASRRVSDEEDVALSVMNNFLNGAARGQFPHLKDRENLWALLIVMTQRKVTDQVRHQHAKKRGGRNVRGESIFMKAGDAGANAGWDVFLGEDPTPEVMLALDEQHAALMEELGDDTLREIARLKLESYTTDEIAEKLGVTSRTVKRKVALIREKWLAYGDAAFGPAE